MTLLLSPWLLLSTLVGVSVQQCTPEGFNALDTVESTEASPDANAIITIDSTFFNCLSTSEIVGIYNSMSVSVLFVQSNDPNNTREIRYNMLCMNNVWKRAGMSRPALRSNETRRDCAQCLNQTVNEDHCTRKSYCIVNCNIHSHNLNVNNINVSIFKFCAFAMYSL